MVSLVDAQVVWQQCIAIARLWTNLGSFLMVLSGYVAAQHWKLAGCPDLRATMASRASTVFMHVKAADMVVLIADCVVTLSRNGRFIQAQLNFHQYPVIRTEAGGNATVPTPARLVIIYHAERSRMMQSSDVRRKGALFPCGLVGQSHLAGRLQVK